MKRGYPVNYKQILLAFQFLTILPIKVTGDVSEKDLSRSAVFFPVVGAFQGLLAACAAALLIVIFPEEIVSGLVIVMLIISNGGFHLDGLADTFDALAVKSSGDREADRLKRLSVMKDSATGAIGVVAIVVVLLLQFLFIKDLFLQAPPAVVLGLLFLMPVYSRWAMVPALCHGTPARKDGLGRVFMDSASIGTIAASFLFVAFLSLAVVTVSQSIPGLKALVLCLSLIVMIYLFSAGAVRFCKERFGGLTGDNFGAISAISEILFLMVTSAWLRHYI